MMRVFLVLFLSLFVFSAFAYSAELVVNGDFEQPISVGWDEERVGSNTFINRATGYDSDPNYEVYVYKGTGSGHTKLFQFIDIPATYLDFLVTAKLYAWDNGATAWAGAAVVIGYHDGHGQPLGETYIAARSSGCPWSNSPTMHVIAVYDSFWHDYSFNIEDELANLSGVDPNDVKEMKITLYSKGLWC